MAHIPGLRVGLPATPQDAYSMLRAAIADPNPVVLIESRALYQSKASVDFGRLDDGVGGIKVKRAGTCATIVSYGSALPLCEQAVVELSGEGLEIQLVDLRWLNPIQWNEVTEAVERTHGVALVVHEANQTGGFGAEIAARLWEYGAKRVHRLGAKDIRVPASPILQDAVLPRVPDVKDAVRQLLTNR